jgi:hypothetical protein
MNEDVETYLYSAFCLIGSLFFFYEGHYLIGGFLLLAFVGLLSKVVWARVILIVIVWMSFVLFLLRFLFHIRIF